MKLNSWVVCKAFLQKLPVDKGRALLRFFSLEQKKKMEEAPSTWKDVTTELASTKQRLSLIHFSWFLPFLRSLSEKDIRLFLGALGKQQAEQIAQQLKLSNYSHSLSSLATTFLEETLLKKVSLGEAHLLVPEALPSSSLNILLSIPLELLKKVIRFLGLHDVAAEVKYIIDSSKLKKLYALLSEIEHNYLKILQQTPEPVIFARMGLSQWEDKEESVNLLIYQRGLNRLAKASYGEHPSFIWHLKHKMEVDQAMLFDKMCCALENSSAKTVLSSQILELLSFLKVSL